MSLSLRRCKEAENVWVANLKATEDDSVHHVVVHEPGLYCIYPAPKQRRSFFSATPLWVFCGRQHVAHTRAHDLYPYFEVMGGDVATDVFVVVGVMDLEQAKSKVNTQP